MKRKRLLGAALLLIATPILAQKAEKPPATPPEKETRLQIGDVQILNYDTLRFMADLSGTRLLGSRTEIVAPDRKSNSVLRLHADEIITRKVNADPVGRIELKDNLRFTITQKLREGERRVTGTAARGNYLRQSQRIELAGSVRIQITDAAALVGPALARSEKLTIDMSAAPYQFTLEGPPAENEIRFAPRDSRPEPKDGKPLRRRELQAQIYAFRSGALQPGRRAALSGPNATLEITDPAEKTLAKLQAEQVTAEFSEEGGDLRRAEAIRNVRYTFERPAPSGETRQTAQGTCGKAVYDLVAGQLELTGSVNTRLIAPEQLQEDGRLAADSITMTTSPPIQYRLRGQPERTLVRLTPRPAEPKTPPEPPSETERPPPTNPFRSFAEGTLTIHGFEEAMLEPGSTLEFTGNRTTYQSVNAKENMLLRIQTNRVQAHYAEDGTIEKAETAGTARFRVERPTADGAARQSVWGTAERVLYRQTAQGQEIELQGPMSAEINDPVTLAKPGRLTGRQGDRLRLIQSSAGAEFEMHSPNQTATFEFTPREERPKDEKARADSRKKT